MGSISEINDVCAGGLCYLILSAPNVKAVAFVKELGHEEIKCITFLRWIMAECNVKSLLWKKNGHLYPNITVESALGDQSCSSCWLWPKACFTYKNEWQQHNLKYADTSCVSFLRLLWEQIITKLGELRIPSSLNSGNHKSKIKVSAGMYFWRLRGKAHFCLSHLLAPWLVVTSLQYLPSGAKMHPLLSILSWQHIRYEHLSLNLEPPGCSSTQDCLLISRSVT